MKRSIFFIVILSCCSFVFAQKKEESNKQSSSKEDRHSSNENSQLYIGVSVGPTIDWFAPTTKDFDLKREKVTAGFIAGINVDVNLTPKRFLYFSTGLFVRYLHGELAFDYKHKFNDFFGLDTSLVLPTVRNYQTMYLTIPTGIKFRTPPSRNCVFVGKIGLSHSFKLGGNQFDSFSSLEEDPEYFITTKKIRNTDAALFAESGYAGLGLEYAFNNNLRVSFSADYSCQFNYFSPNAKNNVADARFRTIVHSLHVVFGVLF